ncbi:MAG TPA: helix-turn-helix domain-containing protein [Candidatus Binataceae bacterium]|nr:helix-turn-helix domain-containing protein [Candidatus Binataceae bacterium]
MKSGGGSVDPERMRKITDEEIRAQIAADPDTAPLTTDFRNFRKVYNPPLPDVKAIRKKMKVSQAEFASRFGFSVRTVQQWEQGRAVPDRPARILLRVIEQSPRAVERALYG